MKSRSPRAALARLARSTRAGSDAGGRSPGHSTPRSERGSESRPSTKSDSGVPDLSAVNGGVLATHQMYSVPDVLSARCTQCQMYSMPDVLSARCTQCQMYSVPNVLSAKCTQCDNEPSVWKVRSGHAEP